MSRYSLQTSFIAVFTPYLLMGQAYFTAGGLRMGPSWGVTVQQRVLERVTAEAVLAQSISNNKTTIHVVGKIHNSLVTKSANLFVGGGIHRSWLHGLSTGDVGDSDQGGIVAVVGGEITLGKINVSWDYRPMLDWTKGAVNFFSAESALYVRYVLVKRVKSNRQGKKKKPQRQKNPGQRGAG